MVNTPSALALAVTAPSAETISSSFHSGSASLMLPSTSSNATSAPPIWPLGLRKRIFKMEVGEQRSAKELRILDREFRAPIPTSYSVYARVPLRGWRSNAVRSFDCSNSRDATR